MISSHGFQNTGGIWHMRMHEFLYVGYGLKRYKLEAEQSTDKTLCMCLVRWCTFPGTMP